MQIAFALSVIWTLSCVTAKAQSIIYVSPNGSGNGSSWGQASSLNDAVMNASSGDELWLLEGIYHVSETVEIAYYQADLRLYGGFLETMSGLDERDYENNETVLDGGGDTQIMIIQGADVLVDGITFQNGYMYGSIAETNSGGGALRVEENNAVLRNDKFLNNRSTSARGGGAILLWGGSGHLIEHCVFENNQAIDGGTGGGAIHNWDKDVTIRSSTFKDNSTDFSGGAIYTWSSSYHISIDDCIFENNESNGSGGAIYTAAVLDLSNTTFTENQSNGTGGAVYNDATLNLSNSTFTENESHKMGGAVYNNVTLTLSNSTFTGNNSHQVGGAICNYNTLFLRQGTFSGNHSSELGGAIYNNRFAALSTIELSRFTENTAEQGGAIYNYSEKGLKVVNSLFVGNQASDKGGAIFNNQFIEIVNTTFVRNTNTALIVIKNAASEYYHNVTHVFNSIFAQNEAKPGGYRADIHSEELNIDLSTQDVRRNILQEYTGTTNLVGVDPAFVNNTDDFRLQTASPGIDAGRVMLFNGISNVNAGETVDLEGNPRNQGTNIDMGAYETDPSTLTVPECATITAPTDEAIDVALDAPIEWQVTADAAGYRVYIGTSAGATDIANGEEVTGTSYTSTTGWDEGTEYFVTIVPFNAAGEAEGCPEISFTTTTLLAAPECTTITGPEDGATDVGLNTAITWTPADGADGYYIYIGTSSRGTDVANGDEVTGTTYAPADGWDEGTEYFITVVPFNDAGEAEGCSEISFTTTTLLAAPECTTITSPEDGATDVGLNTEITWTPADGADGYLIYIGTSSGYTDILDREEVTETNYTPTTGWDEGTEYFVTVVPFNDAGEAEDCPEISFTTTTLLVAPECTTITGPEDGATDVGLNTAITWTPADGADGYRVYIGTSSGDTDILDGEEVTGTSYTPTTGWDEGTEYFVTIVPFNAASEAEDCPEINFTTTTLLAAPECTTITGPEDGATDVGLNTEITWTPADGADGYYIYIGTSSRGTDVANGDEVTGTTYAPADGWDEGTEYFITVVPFNDAGEAEDCPEISFTTTTLLAAPECTTITGPKDGATDVGLNTAITWTPADRADGYRVYIGTSSGDTDILDGEEVTGTTYTSTTGWEENTEYFVTIVPFNAAGEAEDCPEISFTSTTLLVAPECTTLTSPEDGATDVGLNAGITWTPADRADGYYIYIGTSSGGTDVANGEEVTGTTYAPADGWDEGTEYFVTVVPFNDAGEAEDCPEISFTTTTLLAAPECTTIIRPQDGEPILSLDAGIAWTPVTDADGYRISIGTTPGGSELVDREVVSGTTYQPSIDFENNTPYYIRVTPFNATGEATGCPELRFLLIPDTRIQRTKYGISPNGDGINDTWQIDGIEGYPENTVSIFNRWGDLVFYLDGYNNQSRRFDGRANKLTRFGAGILPAGTYFFSIEYTDEKALKKVEGMLVIKR